MSAGGEDRPVRRAFRLPGSRERVRQDVDAEIAFHLEGRIEELVAGGMSREEAEAEARARFGDTEEYRRQAFRIDERTLRRRGLGELAAAVRRETRVAARALARSRGFAPIAILTLALGIAATTAIFTVLDRVVLRPLPFAHADRLVVVEHAVPGIDTERRWGSSVASYFHYADNTRSLEAIGAYVGSSMTFTGDEGADRVPGALITHSTFDVLGLRAIRGRLFTPDEAVPGGPAVVVLSRGVWERRFGADPELVGRTIDINLTPHEVVGIAEDIVELRGSRIEGWRPFRLDRAARPINSHYVSVVGRLAPGVPPEAAQAELEGFVARFTELYPTAYDEGFMQSSGFSPRVLTLREVTLGGIDRVLWVLLGAVALVLVIACANVANLFLIRLESRRRATAVRTALGAGRGDLVLHYLTESLIVAVAGAALGIWLAHLAIRLVLRLAPTNLPRLAEVQLGSASILFALGLALAAAVLFTVIPLMRRALDLGVLREGGRGLTPSRRQHVVRGGLVVAQTALALMLLAGAGLMIQSFRQLASVHPGIEPAGVLTFEIALPFARYEDYVSVAGFHQRLAERLEALPGVQRAAMHQGMPLGGGSGCSLVFTERMAGVSPDRAPCVPTVIVSPGYFEALGITVRGATRDWSDERRAAEGVVVSEALAGRLWPGEDAIGKGIKGNGSQPPFYRVVGVARDVRAHGLDEPPYEAVYFPLIPMEGAPLWSPLRSPYVSVRTSVDRPETLTPAIRQLLAELDPTVPMANVRTLEQIVAESMSRVSFTMVLLGIAASMALLLSAVGIYGVISYIVAQRRSEIGIRMALGAHPGEVSRLVVRQSLVLAGIGVGIGLMGAFATMRVLEALLHGVSPTDPATFAAVTLVLLGIAGLASFAPARRAARVDPAEVLRAE